MRDGPGREALRRTLRTAGRTVVFSSLTVAAAMLSLLVFPQRFLYSMAISGSITALSAGLIALTALPALLMALGPRVDALAPQRWRHREVDPESGFWYRLSHLVMRRPLLVAVTTAAVLIAAGIPFTRIEFTGVDASVLPDSAASKQVDSALRDGVGFPPGRTAPLQVAVSAPRGRAASLRAYAGQLAERDDVAAVDRPRFVGDGTWHIEVVPTRPALDGRTLDLVRAVRAGPSAGGIESIRVAGESARFVDQRAGLADRLPLAIAVLAITTLLILFAMTGSVVLPLKALVMNALGLSAAFGLLVLVFQDGRLEGLLDYTSQGALEITQPLVLLAIAFGLSTDYGVFLLTRIKEARDAGASNEEAVALGIQRTGRHRHGGRAAARRRAGRVRDVGDRLRQAARHRHGRSGRDRRDDRPRAARASAHEAARRAQLVGPGAARAAARAPAAGRLSAPTRRATADRRRARTAPPRAA